MQGQTDGLGGAEDTRGWQQLRRCPRVSFQALGSVWEVLGDQLVLQGIQDRLGGTGISLDHPVVLIL